MSLEAKTKPLIPLDRQVFEVRRNGKNELVPALDKMWMTPITYLDYTCPVEGMDSDLWLERMKLLEEDLQWLLCIPYNKFWSQVIYDEELHYAVDSYLNFAPRYYDVPIDDGLNAQIQEMQDSLHRLFFMIFLRMSVFKETKARFITPSVFGEILYDNFVFDIPKLMDICVLYGRSNRELCEVMIKNIFQCQEKYVEDFTNSIPDISTAFSAILENLQLSNDPHETVVAKAGPSHQSFNGYEPISLNKLLDVSFYLLDCCGTLLSFMEIYPPCVSLLHKENFAEKIGGFYEAVVPFLLKEFKKHRQQESSSKIVAEASKRLSVIRNFLLKIFHLIVTTCCLNPVLETTDLGIINACCEDFLETFMNLLSEKTFIVDYQKRYPIGEDLYLFRQANVQIDESRTSFLEECIKDMVADCAKAPILPKTSVDPKMDIPTAANACYQNGNVETEEMIGATASDNSDVQLASLISQVKDLLPQLSDNFIEVPPPRCLKHYSYKTEDVINAILEESLHPSLQKLNRSDTNKVTKPVEPAPTILSQRRNIFDYDEFDVFHRDNVDVSKIHKGKRKDQHKDGKSLLDDKDEHLKSITRDYEFKVHLEENMHIYDDEYDDTYDDPIVGMEDDRTPDEILSLRPFTTPRVLEKRTRAPREVSSEDEVPEVEETTSTGRSLNFVEDPAVIRERLAAARRGGHAGHRDVKGKPKGHGQEDNVVRNRAFKEKNKSFRGNHSRRAMADRKRQRGMIPS